jgi:hypothetical protein
MDIDELITTLGWPTDQQVALIIDEAQARLIKRLAGKTMAVKAAALHAHSNAALFFEIASMVIEARKEG